MGGPVLKSTTTITALQLVKMPPQEVGRSASACTMRCFKIDPGCAKGVHSQWSLSTPM